MVFERELFPRPHVGESLVPSSTRVFRDLDFLPVMEEAGFPHKFGAVWTATGEFAAHVRARLGRARGRLRGRHPVRGAGAGGGGTRTTPTTWIGANSTAAAAPCRQKLGAEVREGVGVQDVDFSDPGMPHIRFNPGRPGTGNPQSGSSSTPAAADTFLGNRLKLKVMDKVFDQYAIHTWFTGYDRLATMKGNQQKGDYIYVHFLPITNSWVWQIPISDTVTSIGVVTQKRISRRRKTGSSSSGTAWPAGPSSTRRCAVPGRYGPSPKRATTATPCSRLPATAGYGGRRRPLRGSDLFHRGEHRTEQLTLRPSRYPRGRWKPAILQRELRTTTKRRSGGERRTGTISSPSTTGSTCCSPRSSGTRATGSTCSSSSRGTSTRRRSRRSLPACGRS